MVKMLFIFTITFYGVIQIVHALNDTGAGEVVDQLSCLGAVLSRINQLCFPGPGMRISAFL